MTSMPTSLDMRLRMGRDGLFTVAELAQLMRCGASAIQDLVRVARLRPCVVGRWELYAFGEVLDAARAADGDRPVPQEDSTAQRQVDDDGFDPSRDYLA